MDSTTVTPEDADDHSQRQIPKPPPGAPAFELAVMPVKVALCVWLRLIHLALLWLKEPPETVTFVTVVGMSMSNPIPFAATAVPL